MLTRFWFFVGLMTLSFGWANANAQTQAQTLNLNPGLWEYTNELRFSEDAEPETQVFESCVTRQDLDSGQFMQQDIDACEMVEQRFSPNQMVYSMACQGPEGTTLDIEANVELNGDRAQGVINNTVVTPMGEMGMVVNLTARRIGPCPQADSN